MNEPSPRATKAAEDIATWIDANVETDIYMTAVEIGKFAAIIERETGCAESQVMIETADQIISRLLQNPHDPAAQAAGGRWRFAYLAKHQPQ